jgi:hypothetical protein
MTFLDAGYPSKLLVIWFVSNFGQFWSTICVSLFDEELLIVNHVFWFYNDSPSKKKEDTQ